MILEDTDVSGLLEKTGDAPRACVYHTFPDPAAVVQLRSQLLHWYDKDKRELPWRTLVWKRLLFSSAKLRFSLSLYSSFEINISYVGNLFKLTSVYH